MSTVCNHPEVSSILEGNCFDPHSFLGFHPEDGEIRIWRPGAASLHLEVRSKLVEATRVHERGLFTYPIKKGLGPLDYRVYHQDGSLDYDPYSMLPVLGDIDSHLFGRGCHYELWRCMGANVREHQGTIGTLFTVWAPNARAVSLVADFNYWNGMAYPMRCLGQSGIWELFVPGVGTGQKYKFEVRGGSGGIHLKADPYAKFSEMRPYNASIVSDIDFPWQDSKWMASRLKGPMNIYEVHLGSWRKDEWRFKNYRDIAHELADYCVEMGFTHVELLPVMEHPLDQSWGYQVTGFFAVTSRYGSVDDFQYFVNHLHCRGIGVLLDWVPAHFPTDDFALAAFDGTSLYEHADPKEGFHPHWNTLIFNYGRKEVSNFLIASALYWLQEMHIDGLRVDAVASMLYRDYGREEGQWIPNQYGEKENIEAIEFLRHLNTIVHVRCPGALMIAEESTSFGGVTAWPEDGGLGFDLKWNMGWMNDTLRYFTKDPMFRTYHHDDLTFGLLYAFTERFALVLSHDEVVHGKKSLLGKMPGDIWQKFAGLRLLYTYMCCQPGKNLLFMGGEIAQWTEWCSEHALEWSLLDYPLHRGIQTLVKEMNHRVLQSPALWERDFDWQGFEWVDFRDRQNSVIAYLRKSGEETLLCVHNFTPATHDHYVLMLKGIHSAEEVFNSDASQYGGSGKTSLGAEILWGDDGVSYGLSLHIAPLATQIYRL